MKTHRPEIFISAATADLGSCRELIKQALLTLDCTPVEQTNFAPAASTVRDMLREKIAGCDAVIHLAGEVYGAEPQERGTEDDRRSYTHLEYEIARELGKPVYPSGSRCMNLASRGEYSRARWWMLPVTSSYRRPWKPIVHRA